MFVIDWKFELMKIENIISFEELTEAKGILHGLTCLWKTMSFTSGSCCFDKMWTL